MDENAKVIHTLHRHENRHKHLLALLIPSIVFAVFLAYFVSSRYQPNKTEIKETIQKSTVTINNNTKINVTVAKTLEEQRQGLSGVKSLEENEGMLFVFGQPSRIPFWMKDMYIDLDMIWISQGKVLQIHKNVEAPEPQTPDSKLLLYVSNDLAEYVLEVNAGFSDKNNIKVGDQVIIE